MKKNNIIIILVMIFGLSMGYAQKQINNYKYVFVSSKFDFLDAEDKYRLNTLTRVLFKGKGFNVINDKQIFPDDYASNNCLALLADVVKIKNILKTKLQIELRNCNNELIFTSQIGESKDKEYKKAYHEALKAAFKSFEGINYIYAPSDNVIKEKHISEKLQNKILVEKSHLTQNGDTDITSVTSKKPVTNINKNRTVAENTESMVTLIAQPVGKTFEVRDYKNNLVMTLIATAKTDVFIIKGEDAILFKSDSQWLKSTNELNVEPIKIKF